MNYILTQGLFVRPVITVEYLKKRLFAYNKEELTSTIIKVPFFIQKTLNTEQKL